MNEAEIRKVTGLLGLARKAGKVICGAPLVTEGIRAGKCRAVVMSGECAPNTKKRLTDGCAYHRVPLAVIPVPMEEFSRLMGKSAPMAAVGVTDAGFARAILTYFTQSEDPADR